MSRTFEIACPDTKKKLWIGQGSSNDMSTFYSGEPETMKKLGDFINAHLGKMLIVLDSEHWLLEDCDKWQEDDNAPQ